MPTVEERSVENGALNNALVSLESVSLIYGAIRMVKTLIALESVVV